MAQTEDDTFNKLRRKPIMVMVGDALASAQISDHAMRECLANSGWTMEEISVVVGNQPADQLRKFLPLL